VDFPHAVEDPLEINSQLTTNPPVIPRLSCATLHCHPACPDECRGSPAKDLILPKQFGEAITISSPKKLAKLYYPSPKELAKHLFPSPKRFTKHHFSSPSGEDVIRLRRMTGEALEKVVRQMRTE
jgi:hypothetical protein